MINILLRPDWWSINHKTHDDVIKWKHFPCYWPFKRGIHRSSVNSPHKGQWCGALMFPLICAWMNIATNNREASDLKCHRPHYDVTIMSSDIYNAYTSLTWHVGQSVCSKCFLQSMSIGSDNGFEWYRQYAINWINNDALVQWHIHVSLGPDSRPANI